MEVPNFKRLKLLKKSHSHQSREQTKRWNTGKKRKHALLRRRYGIVFIGHREAVLLSRLVRVNLGRLH
jgi:hypothetical protein